MTDSEEIFLSLPFREVEGDDFEEIINQTIGGGQVDKLYSNYEHLTFKNFDPREHKSYEFENDIDPDNNLYNNLNIKCEYYNDDQFKELKMDESFSIIHFNSRSLNKNFHKIRD